MNVLKELRIHEDDQLEKWLSLDEKDKKKFMKEVLKFANVNPEELKAYCQTILPAEFSSLSIIYEALTRYSTDWNAFVAKELKRLIFAAKNDKFDPLNLSLLEDIETEDFYAKTKEVYTDVINYLTNNLSLEDEENLTFQMLETLEWFLIEMENEEEFKESTLWAKRLKFIAENGTIQLKVKAREILESDFSLDDIKPLSMIEKLTKIFVN
jgi:hypothetical protein